MADVQSPSHPHALGYARRPKFSHRWLIYGTVFLVGAVAAAALFRWRHELGEWFSLVRLRHAAITYVNASAVAPMTQLPTDNARSWGSTTAARYAGLDAIWQEVDSRLIPRLRATRGSSVTLFLHERVSPSGNRRVVAVNLSPSWGDDGSHIDVDIRLFEPGTMLHPRFRELTVRETPDLPVFGHIPGFPGACCMLATVPWGSEFRLYPGRADAYDRSRFIIDYVHNGVRGSFIGELGDDDAITFRSNDGKRLPIQLSAQGRD